MHEGDDALGTSASAGLGTEWARSGHEWVVQWLGGDVGRRLGDGDRQLLPRMAVTCRQTPEGVDAEGIGDVTGKEEMASALGWF